MAEFYTWTLQKLVPITLLIALCILAQAPAMIMSWYRRRSHSRLHLLENMLELFVLLQIFILALMHGQVLSNYDLGLLAPIGYGGLNYAAYAAAVFSVSLACTILILNKKVRLLLTIIVSCVTLPAVEKVCGNAYAWLFIAALIFWLLRAVYLCIVRYREISTNISAFSIKSAIDSLHTGIIFCEPNGHILLCNAEIQQLMAVITGKVQRNARQFYDLISSGKIEPGCHKAELEEQVVILLPDESAWMFTKTILTIKNGEYIQITATDISERWKLTAVLQGQRDDLVRRQIELNDAIANLYAFTREKEMQRAKAHTHDLLSERIALLQQTIRQDQEPDQALLRALSQKLLDDLKATERMLPPLEELDVIKKTYAAIGVDVQLAGKLPDDSEKSRLFVEIAREAVNNAVRHGFATKVHIFSTDEGGLSRLQITDNGRPVSGEIKEGGGISGMRHRLKQFNGELSFSGTSGFMLTVTIPMGEVQ